MVCYSFGALRTGQDAQDRAGPAKMLFAREYHQMVPHTWSVDNQVDDFLPGSCCRNCSGRALPLTVVTI